MTAALLSKWTVQKLKNVDRTHLALLDSATKKSGVQLVNFDFFQATEHYRQPPWLDDFQEITNLFFVVLFTFEMFLKMYSLGFQVRQPL